MGFPEDRASGESDRAMVTVLWMVVVCGRITGVLAAWTEATGAAPAPPAAVGGASAKAMRGPMRRPAMASITAPTVSAPTRTRDGSGEVLRCEFRIISIRSFS